MVEWGAGIWEAPCSVSSTVRRDRKRDRERWRQRHRETEAQRDTGRRSEYEFGEEALG